MKLKLIITAAVAICLTQIAFGQNDEKKSNKKFEVTGIVVGIQDLPVDGAFFYVDSVRANVESKKDGSYKIKVRPSDKKLMVYSPLFGYSEAEINGQTTINFKLNGVANVKDPAKPKAIKIRTYTDIYQMIRGEVNGVVVNGRSIQTLRSTSFSGSKEVLLMVNGSIVNTIFNVLPADVKKIEYIKGSAAAIYGDSANNGIISITLKTGSEKE